MRPFIWAHRGASTLAPENTLEAFQKAADVGANGIELDIQLSKDGEIVVTHDETINRCSNGKGAVAEMTLEQLRSYEFNAGHKGYHCQIPTLREVYKLVKPTNLLVNIELKNGMVLYEGMEQKALALAAEMGMEDRVMYSSFNHYSLAGMRQVKDVTVSPLYQEGLFEPWRYAQYMGAQAVNPFFRNLMAPGLMQGCKQAGIQVNVWTPDREQDLQMCIDAGVDGIITNEPQKALELLEA